MDQSWNRLPETIQKSIWAYVGKPSAMLFVTTSEERSRPFRHPYRIENELHSFRVIAITGLTYDMSRRMFDKGYGITNDLWNVVGLDEWLLDVTYQGRLACPKVDPKITYLENAMVVTWIWK